MSNLPGPATNPEVATAAAAPTFTHREFDPETVTTGFAWLATATAAVVGYLIGGTHIVAAIAGAIAYGITTLVCRRVLVPHDFAFDGTRLYDVRGSHHVVIAAGDVHHVGVRSQPGNKGARRLRVTAVDGTVIDLPVSDDNRDMRLALGAAVTESAPAATIGDLARADIS